MESTKTSSLLMNPLVRKLTRVDERADSPSDAATYGGVLGKTIYFLALLVVGMVGVFLVEHFLKGQDTTTINGMTFSVVTGAIALLCLIVMLVAGVLSFLSRPLIPVTGTLFCLATGFVFAFAAQTLTEYTAILWGALVLTLLIVLVMAFLYLKGIVQVDQKFKAIVTTLFVVSIGGGVITALLSLIPALQPVMQQIESNYVISIISAVIFIIIASLFLLVDFQTIRETVENEMDKKYEWLAAFGLVFTVLWLYLKVVDLLVQLAGKNNNSSNS